MISWRSAIIVLVVALLGVGIYNLQQQRKTLDAEAADLRAKFEKLKAEKNITIADIAYFEKIENRLKEAKKRRFHKRGVNRNKRRSSTIYRLRKAEDFSRLKKYGQV